VPENIKEKIFLKLFEECKIANYKPKEYMEYEESAKNYNDWFAITQTIKKEGVIEGKKEGVIEGKKEGVIEGKKETAKKMKEEGLSVTLIAKYIGLSESEIKQL
jgi:predicted transposase/invertase (TIGR01784 family)